MMKHLIIPVAGLIAFYAILALAAAELGNFCISFYE